MKSSIRKIARFLLLTLLIQTAGVLFFTPESVERFLPLFLLGSHETIVCGDNSFTDYYALHSRIGSAEVIVLGGDYSVPSTYGLTADFLRALKFETNVGTVLFDFGLSANESLWNGYLEVYGEDDEETDYYASLLLSEENGPAVQNGFHVILGKMNRNYPPQRRFSVAITDETGERSPHSLAESAGRIADETGRPVLVLTDASKLADSASPLRTAGNSVLPIQIRYNEAPDLPVIDFGTPIWLVDSTKMTTFDRWYGLTERKISGRSTAIPFTRGYSTEVFFLIFTQANEETGF